MALSAYRKFELFASAASIFSFAATMYMTFINPQIAVLSIRSPFSILGDTADAMVLNLGIVFLILTIAFGLLWFAFWRGRRHGRRHR